MFITNSNLAEYSHASSMQNTYIFKALTFDPTVIQLLKRIYSHEKK